MTGTRLTKVLAAVLAASTLASCGESVLDAAEQRDQRRDSKHRAELRQAERGVTPARADERTSHGGKRPARGTVATSGTVQGDDRVQPTVPDAEGSQSGRTPPKPTRAPRPAVSCADDMTGDLESSGSAPSYADLRSGCLREEREQVALETTTLGALPVRMPDRDTHFAITFVLERATGATVYVTAEATDQGWTAMLSRGQSQRSLPAPSVTGNALRVSVPAAEMGPGAVEWRYESSWLRSTLTSTAYAFDDAPNGGGGVPFDRG